LTEIKRVNPKRNFVPSDFFITPNLYKDAPAPQFFLTKVKVRLLTKINFIAGGAA